MTEAERKFVEALEDFYLAVHHGLSLSRVDYCLRETCKTLYPDSLVADDSGKYDKARVEKLICKLTDPLAYDQLYL